MTQYYVIVIGDGDDKIKGKSIYSFDTQVKAIAAFHQRIGNAMNSELYTQCLVVVIDSYGNLIQKESYIAPAPETF